MNDVIHTEQSGEAQKQFPEIAKVNATNIPDLLKKQDRWLVWKAGPLKENGKFDKIPIDPNNGRALNGNDPANWMTFEQAIAAHEKGIGDGVGVALNEFHQIDFDGAPHFLVALDFDNIKEGEADLRELWMSLGKIYVEASPSGKGLRMFALSTEKITGGNDGNGHEMYMRGRFVTVTGHGGRGSLRAATDRLVELDQAWFGKKSNATSLVEALGTNIFPSRPPETPENIEIVKAQLACVSSDIAYSPWRNIIWSIQSTGWRCAEALARDWSMKAANRYDEAVFDKLVSTFDPARTITPGTLHFHAKQNGWVGQSLSHSLTNNGASAVAASPHKLLTADEVRRLPNLAYRVQDLLPMRGVASIYGEPGSGKSFLAFDLCYAIARGMSHWFGLRVEQGPVVYLALEGQAGISKRLKACEMHHGHAAPPDIRFMLGAFNLLDGAQVSELARQIVDGGLQHAVVVVDTLNQSAPGSDENNSADMGKIIAGAKSLAAAVDGIVVLVHHSGKDRARGMRGHSSLIAALDAAVEVVRAPEGRSWRSSKEKDGPDGQHAAFELVTHVVDTDPYGLPVTSCAVRQALIQPGAKKTVLRGKNQIAALAAVKAALAGTAGVPLQGAIAAVAAALVHVPQGRRLTVAKATLDDLTTKRVVLENKGVVTLP